MKMIVTYGYGTDRRNNYSVVEGADASDCHRIVAIATGNKYAFMYPDDNATQEMIAKYHLREVPLGPHKMRNQFHGDSNV